MKRICAWHPQNFGFELVIEEGTGHETHGICPDCKTIEVAKLDIFRLASNEQFGEPYIPESVPLNLLSGTLAEMQQRRDLLAGREARQEPNPPEEYSGII